MALTATSVYTQPDAFFLSVVIVALVFGAINLPSVGIWAAFGVGLRGFLAVPARLRAFNVAMAVLLALSVVPFVL
jgi:threonine/homoserine/homoserine lactone efflux protein